MDARYIDSFLSVLEQSAPNSWRWARSPKAQYWWIQYTAFQPPCTFYLEVGPALICLHAVMRMSIWAECRPAVYRYLLRLNEEMSGAKFGLGHDGRISLMVEWPHERLTFTGFEMAVQTLLHYYELYFHDVQLVAQDTNLAHELLAQESEERSLEQEIAIEVEPPASASTAPGH